MFKKEFSSSGGVPSVKSFRKSSEFCFVLAMLKENVNASIYIHKFNTAQSGMVWPKVLMSPVLVVFAQTQKLLKLDV